MAARLNASVTPDSSNEAYDPQNHIGAVDINADAIAMPGYPRIERLIAAIAYFGPFSLFVSMSKPSRRFVNRHLNVAIALFIVRSLWLASILMGWWLSADAAPGESKIREFALDVLFSVIIGFPLSDTWTSGAFAWLSAPVAITLLASGIGATLAISGKSADFQAFASANWSDPLASRSILGNMTPDDERALARRARERQIERLAMSSRLLRTEEARRSRIADVQVQIERIELQREYHDQLLALGEISQRRYDQVNTDLDSQASALRTQLSNLETRIQNPALASSDAGNGNRLKRPDEVLVESLAIVTPDGIPIFTYGRFQLDDAIVAGMLSAFDSLSEEVFGSRVSKTALAEGQVLFFAHGDYVLVMANFVDEPAPRQIEELREMLNQFEAANKGPLSRKQYDPKYLHEVIVPFRFADRLWRSS